MTAPAGRRWWWVALFFSALILAGAFYLDRNVHGWVVQHQTRGLRKFMLGVSRWGDWPGHVIVGVTAAAAAYVLGQRAWLRIFVAMIVACALAGSAARVIKITTGRARPSVSTEAGWNGPSLNSKYHAFPSGHTASSTAFFAVLFLARRRIAFAFLPIPILIASSRVLLDAHHLSDVVFGALLGILFALLVWRFVCARYSETSSAAGS